MSLSNNRKFRLRIASIAGIAMAMLAMKIVAQQVNRDTVTSALSAAFGNARPHEIAMRGTVTMYGGAKPEQGTVKLVANDNGDSHVHFALSSEEHDEEQWEESNQHRCRVLAAGKEDTRVTPNCWAAAPWFFPELSLVEAMKTKIQNTDLGLESEDGLSLHVIQGQRLPDSRFRNDLDRQDITDWSKTKLRLDSQSLLPKQFEYTLFSDRGIRTKIAVQILYADYRSEQGIQVPHHIQRFINKALQADIQISSVEIK